MISSCTYYTITDTSFYYDHYLTWHEINWAIFDSAGEEDSKRPGRMQQSLNSELIMPKEQLFDMFQQILGIKKFEHQLLFNALQVSIENIIFFKLCFIWIIVVFIFTVGWQKVGCFTIVHSLIHSTFGLPHTPSGTLIHFPHKIILIHLSLPHFTHPPAPLSTLFACYPWARNFSHFYCSCKSHTYSHIQHLHITSLGQHKCWHDATHFKPHSSSTHTLVMLHSLILNHLINWVKIFYFLSRNKTQYLSILWFFEDTVLAEYTYSSLEIHVSVQIFNKIIFFPIHDWKISTHFIGK